MPNNKKITLHGNPYPYQDRTRSRLPGEIWKDVPGFEMSFQVSNMGRVRSLDRTVPHSRCGSQFVAGRILSQIVKKHYNSFTKDHVVILHVTLMMNNTRYEYSVRRLVYAAFINKKILTADKRMVVAKDNDGYNNRLKNLELIDNSEKQKRILARGRAEMKLAILDHSKFKPTFNLWKPVHRCDKKGKIIATYPSIAAARKDGFTEKMITEAAKGRIKTYKGYRWKYASRKVLQPLINNWHH